MQFDTIYDDDRQQFVWLIADNDTPHEHLTHAPIGFAWLSHPRLRDYVAIQYPQIVTRIANDGILFLQEELPYSQRHAEAVAERFERHYFNSILQQLERRVDLKAFHDAIAWLRSIGYDTSIVEKQQHEECPLSA